MSKLKPFHRIALMGRAGIPGVPETLELLKNYLLSLQKTVVIEQSAAELISCEELPIISAQALSEHADLLIVVGGDGSLINAAHNAILQDLPILGINRGRLGFLTDIPPQHLELIAPILDGHYRLEQRFLLDARIEHPDIPSNQDMALNDVVLLPGDVAQMIEFDIYVNGQIVCHQRADGLIVATPTGSTAYALSGGGPILHPELDAIVLVPMFPHTLSSRPIVVRADSAIDIAIATHNLIHPYVSCDGQNRISIPPGGQLKISQKEKRLSLIHPLDYNYYRILREKLGWEKSAQREIAL